MTTVTLLQLLLLLLSGRVAQSELSFLSGPLANATYTVVPTSLYIGPQTDAVTVSGLWVALTFIDACAPGDIRALVSGNIVVISEGACSPERQYDAMVGQGAVAIIALSLWRPGGLFCYMRDGVVQSATQAAPYLQLTFGPELIPTFLPGPVPVRVTLRPDPNPWRTMYDSAAYQAVMRWIPSLGLACASALSWLFLGQHGRLLLERYRQTVPEGRRSPRRLAGFLVRQFSTLHFALIVQGGTTAAVAVEKALGGYFSAPHVPGPVQRFFQQDLSGYTLVSLQIASAFWNRIRIRALSRDGHRNVLVRLLTGELHLASAFWYAVVLVNELATAILNATYATYLLGQPALIVIQVVVVLGILFIGTQFLVSVLRFWAAVRGTSTATDQYVRGLSRNVVALGAALLVQVVIRLAAVDPSNLRPGMFFGLFATASWAHVVECVLVAVVLKPRTKSAAAPLGVVVGGGDNRPAAAGSRVQVGPTTKSAGLSPPLLADALTSRSETAPSTSQPILSS